MTGVWLLPIVAAVSGALLIPHLPPSDGFTILVLCYTLWAFSVPVAMSILVILLLRLALHKLPKKVGWRSAQSARVHSGSCCSVVTRQASLLRPACQGWGNSPSASGSSAAPSCGVMNAECRRMVSEKIAATAEAPTAAVSALAAGKAFDVVASLGLAPVQKAVRGNQRRLAWAKRFYEITLPARRIAGHAGLSLGRILPRRARS